MSLVLGKNVVLFIYDSGMWKGYVCGRNISYTVTTSSIKTSVSGAGSFATYMMTEHNISGSLDGIVSLEVANVLTLPELRALQLSKQKLLMRFQRTDTASNVYTDELYIFLTESTDSASFDDLNVFNISFIGSGPVTQIFTPTLNTANKVKRYQYTGAAGESTFTVAALINKDVLEVVKDGIGYSKLITSGTPVDKKVKYTTGTGTFESAIGWEPGEEGYILYQDI